MAIVTAYHFILGFETSWLDRAESIEEVVVADACFHLREGNVNAEHLGGHGLPHALYWPS